VGAMVSHPATVLHRALDLLLAKADADVQAEAASKSAAEAAERAAASSSGGLDVNGLSASATAAADAEAATADAYVESVPAAFLHFSTIFAEATQDKMVAAAATAVSVVESEDEMASNFSGLEGLVMEVVGGAHAAPVLSGWWWGLDEAHSDTLCDAIVACTMAFAAAYDAGAAAAAASSGGYAAGDAQDLPAIRLVRAVLAKYHELMDERGEDDSEISDDDIGEEVSAPYAAAVAAAPAVAAAEGGGGASERPDGLVVDGLCRAANDGGDDDADDDDDGDDDDGEDEDDIPGRQNRFATATGEE